MIKTSFLRKAHRILGVVIGVQLLLWTVSGAIFAWNDIEKVRGDDMRIRPGAFAIDGDWVSPTAIAFGDRLDAGRVEGFDLVQVGEDTCYRFEDAEGRTVLADVRSGLLRDPLTSEEASDLARASFDAEVPVASVTLLEEGQVGAHHEYRGGPLPAWVVQLDHPSKTRVYVSQQGAAVTTHRNRTWRVFDFFWMLHTMDYRGRDDFNHALIKFISLAAITLAISGYFLFSRTSATLRRRR